MNPGAPVRIALIGEGGETSSASRVKGGTYRLTGTLYDQYGNAASPSQITRYTFASTSSTGQFGSSPIVYPGTTTFTTTYHDTVSGVYDITVSGGNVTSNAFEMTYTEGTPTSLRYTPSSANVRAGAVQPLEIIVLNEHGIEVATANDIAVSLVTPDASGVFLDGANVGADELTDITVAAGTSRADVYYRQTTSGVVNIRAEANDLEAATARLNILPESVASVRFINAPYTESNPLEINQSGAFRVQLYDVYGNIATTPQRLTLYASSNDGAPARTFTIQAGNSTGTVDYTYTTPGSYELTISDAPNGVSQGLGTIAQDAVVVYGEPAAFQFDQSSFALERGGVAPARASLYNRYGGAVPAPAGGTTIQLSMYIGTGQFSTTVDGTFTDTLDLVVPEGEFGAGFYYRNDDARIDQRTCYTGLNGVRTCSITARYEHTIRGRLVADGNTTYRYMRANMQYGAATQLVFTTPERSQYAQHPSDVLTVQRQNQYGKAVPANADMRVYLRSTAGSTGEFSASSTTGWGANYVTLLNGNDSVNFHYRDAAEGTPTLTAADSIPLEPDTGMTNATQHITINRQVLDHLFVTNISDPQRAGTASSVVVMARDAENYVVPWYDGTIAFMSDDPAAFLPSEYTFDPNVDKGSKTFTNQVAFTTPGEKIVTATDIINPSIRGSQTDITVTAANTAPVARLEISQPRSPAQFAVDAASPAITLQLRDETGEATTAPIGGLPVRLMSTSPTAQFALSSAGPWTNGLITTVPEGLTFLNFYYRDTALGQAQINVSDWIDNVDRPEIENAQLDVVINRVGLSSESRVYSRNVFGQMEESTYLFTSRADGRIVGRTENTFNSYSFQSGQPLDVLWRTQWRQGVVLLDSRTHDERTSNVSVDVATINTEAGRPNFYAVAEATDTSFAVPEAVVSRENTIPTSPWRLGITQSGYALVDEDYELVVNTYRQDVLTDADSLLIQVLPADATDASGAVYGETVPAASGQYRVTLPADILGQLGTEYKLFVTALDGDGATIAQILSDSFEVVETLPEVEPEPEPQPQPQPNPGTDPTTPVVPTPQPTPDGGDQGSTLGGSTEDGRDGEAGQEGRDDDAATDNDEDAGVPGGQGGGTGSGTTDPSTTEGTSTPLVVSMYAGTLLLVIALLREAYKEVAKVYHMRRELRRLARIAADKHTFLSLSSHHLRTPIALLEAALSIVPAAAGTLGAVVGRLQRKAEQLLEQDVQPQLETIKDPDVQRATRSALRSPFFWLPIILSIVLTIAVNWLLTRTAQGLVHNDALVYTSIIGVALALIVFFGARTVYINKERKELAQATERARTILFAAKTRFIQQVEADMRADIEELRQIASTLTNGNETALRSIREGTTKLEALATKLDLISTMDGVVLDPTTVTANDLVRYAVERHQAELNARGVQLDIQSDGVGRVRQDERLLRYVMSTVLSNAIHSSEPGQTIRISTETKGDKVSIAVSDNTEDAELRHHAFDPFVTEAENGAGGDIGLSLYLDKLIIDHLGGDIATTDAQFGRGGAIRVRFNSLS